MKLTSMPLDWRHTTLSILLLIGVAGCGSDQKTTAPVSGKVTYNNAPVTGGSLTFAPTAEKGMPGVPGTAEIQSDGSFTVTTYAKGDGAVVGNHTLRYVPPAPPAIDEKQHSENSKPVISPFFGLMPKTAAIEIKAGENKIDVELIPDPKIDRSGM